MIVYLLAPYEGGEHLDWSVHVDLLRKAGRPQADSWVPFDVELVSRKGRRALEAVDSPYLDGSFLVVKDAVLPRVKQELAPYVEFLPLRCAQQPLTLLNVLQVVDALDEEESDLKRFASSGRIMFVNRHVFRPEAVPSDGLFRIPQAVEDMFCTEATAEVLRERLTGLNLRPVWEG